MWSVKQKLASVMRVNADQLSLVIGDRPYPSGNNLYKYCFLFCIFFFFLRVDILIIISSLNLSFFRKGTKTTVSDKVYRKPNNMGCEINNRNLYYYYWCTTDGGDFYNDKIIIQV